MSRPVFLSGRVVADDGAPLDQTAVIETVCNGFSHAETYTDSKGRFSFELGGRDNGAMQDASESHSLEPAFGLSNAFPGQNSSGYGGLNGLERLMMNCDVQARVPGYQSESVSLVTHRQFDNPDIGTILVHRLGKVEGRVVSATTLAAPKDARKAFEKGMEAERRNKPDEAIKSFQKAVAADPDFAAAWCEMGKLQILTKQNEAAAQSLQAAIKADPKFLHPYLFLAILQAAGQQWKDLAATTDQALGLDPYDSPMAYFFNAVANYNLQKLDAAEKSARQEQKLDTRHHYVQTWKLLGMILAQRRDYPGAAEQMRGYLEYAPKAADAGRVRAQLAELEKLQGSASVEEPAGQQQ
ncbi:MAG: tetratricopeptide repeat protein [Acidobacteriia bacterium]|nr:tetratricopeptide repeat protein [Terriglobia bacterium]